MSFIEKLQARWQLKSLTQVILVLIVFACTGFSVLFLKVPLFTLLGFKNDGGILGILLYLVIMLPLYQVLLLFYGFLFGQFSFFWNFEKKTFQRMAKIFSGKDKKV